MTPTEFHDAVRAYCAAVGASETSGGRTEVRNAGVGGVSGSAHRFWLGRDVVYDDDLSPAQRELAKRKLGLRYVIVPKPAAADRISLAARLGLKLLVENDHDHLQPMDWVPG